MAHSKLRMQNKKSSLFKRIKHLSVMKKIGCIAMVVALIKVVHSTWDVFHSRNLAQTYDETNACRSGTPIDCFKKEKIEHRYNVLGESCILRLHSKTNKDLLDNQLLRPMLIERVPDTPGNRKVQTFITSYMKNLKWDVTTDHFQDETPHGHKYFTNIIASHNVQSPRKLVIACHFDSKYFEHIKFVGATDSAVPCAIMLDLARTLTPFLVQSGLPKISLQMIFFDGEEAFQTWSAVDSTYGARHLAELMGRQRVSIDREYAVSALESLDMIVLLDLIGTKAPVFRNYFDATSRHVHHLVKIESRLKAMNLLEHHHGSYFRTEKTSSYIEDDHIPFLRRNVPIIHMISNPFPSVWHTEKDNYDALDWPTINNLNLIFRVFIAEYLHVYT